MTWTSKSHHSTGPFYKGRRRFEHWYRDNQVYFITARCRERFPAFSSDEAKAVFWDRFDYYTVEAEFTPWITTLVDNHYHSLGYCRIGAKMKTMMQRIHGSVAKLVNDLLPKRLLPFWGDEGHQQYYDGCIRDERQCRSAYRYIQIQSVRHGLCDDWREYPHTHIRVELESDVRRALELRAFLEGVPYKRYENRSR